MIIDVSLNNTELSIGDAFLCKNGNAIRFVGSDNTTDEIVILNSMFVEINRYKTLEDVSKHYTIVKVIKNKNIKISEVNDNE